MHPNKFFLFKISGVVQGVGFRPFFYREARKKELKGYIKNTGVGVEVLADNKEVVLAILKNLPPLAKIEKLEILEKNSEIFVESGLEFQDFKILFSENKKSEEGAQIPADTSICEDCVEELLNPKNRRYQYFFISCTNCGPRYSIAERIPFDRENTSLKDFILCKNCEKEYKDPENRRFHAQTTACSDCGPKLEFYKDGEIQKVDPLLETIDLLKKNEILSIKGIGGFFLTCMATEKNIQKLRKTLNRPRKPLAIMVKNLEMAGRFCEISEKEKEVLLSKERAIVLLKKSPLIKGLDGSDFLSRNNRIGIMLPYTGIHHMLFEKINQPLIITSANMPGIPIPTKREAQNWKYILDYNREITNFSDDSIIKVIEENPLLIRRSRGFVPNTIKIPENFCNFKKDILAVGTEMKNTFCLKKGNQIIFSPHIGNTGNLENFENFKKTLEKFLKLTKAQPKIILCDKNPSFQISDFAKKYAQEKGLKLVEAQHHISHVFSVALEHNLENFIGISADGTGWGEDEKVWGGEVFRVNFQNKVRDLQKIEPIKPGLRSNIQRIGHLEYQKLVGGDIANKQPVRFLVGILEKFMDIEAIENILCRDTPRRVRFKKENIKVFQKQAQQNFNCIETSSCGRILDAVSILLGFGEENFYEGYLAEMLESGTSTYLQSPPLNPHRQGDLKDFLEPIIEKQNGQYILKTTELFKFLIENLEKIPKEDLAQFSMLYLAKGLYEIARRGKALSNIPVVFSGGCAHSSIMTKYFLSKGIKINQNIPAGDGGISAGQIGYFLWQNKF